MEETKGHTIRSPGREVGSFFCVGFFFFFGSFGAARLFFWPILGFFLVIALLHDFAPYYFVLHDFFLVAAPPLPPTFF